MRIDRTHRSWFIASLTILIIAALAYIPYALFYPGGPRGNSLPGLAYGVVGYGMMLFAGLLGARKKVPIWRIGRAQTWMRGHLWLGALSLPMILFHAAFAARGPLTMVMTVLLYAVVLSGITGAAIQHFVPRRMFLTAPQETIYEEIPNVREQLLAEASAIVDKLCAEPQAAALAAASLETGRATVAVVEEEDEIVLSDEERANVRRVYVHEILPFLRNPDSRDSPLSVSVEAQRFFEALRRQSPPAVHESLRDLESICSEERQLSRQRRVYFLLHGWLLVHVPLSITLLVLGGIHALVAIRY
jgi:hypothetical protein